MASKGVLHSVREDDFVEYWLFPTELDQKDVSLENCETQVEELRAEVNKLAQDYCHRYIWHRDGFKISIRQCDRVQRLLIEASTDQEVPAAQLPQHLYGISHYGDNVQDEWFIVSLLFHLTKRIPGLLARIVDSDGEFILIEAAEHLPRWANPERCEGRVFIYGGNLFLIGTEDQKEAFSMERVIQEIKLETRSKWVVSEEIKSCIEERIKDFPDKIEEHHHRATLFVPVGVAAALQENPQLVSAAVLAFCNRDPIDLKACRAMRFFPPECCVYTSTVFTRCLYAMLMHSNYLPDRRTGWNIPLVSDPNHKAHMLGLKLACGFEILASQAKSSQALEMDKGWQSYFELLKTKGYFKDNIEGSQEYSRLLKIAQEYFQENRDSMKFMPKIGEEIVSILEKNEFDVDELRRQSQNLPVPDDDSWMNISSKELDQLLADRYGSRQLFSLNGNTSPETFSNLVNDFLEQKSEFDGVDQDAAAAQLDLGDSRPVKPKRTKSKAKADVQNNLPHSLPLHQPIDFDPDAFGGHVKHMLDLVIPEDRWDSSDNSDMSDYDDEAYAQNIEDMASSRKAKGVKTELQAYMEQMDRELANTTIGKSFETDINEQNREDEDVKRNSDLDDFDDIESFKPVNIDVNVLKNMMESYQSQIGGPGPAANLLGSMGVHLSRASSGPSKTKSGNTKQTDV